MKKQLLLMVSLTVMAQEGFAQPPGNPSTPNDTLQSVRVQSEGRLVFSIYAPKASEVTVAGDFSTFEAGTDFANRKKALTRDAVGVWSYTTSAPIPADAYSYQFEVDGVLTLDPRNTQIKESEHSLANYVVVSGDGAAYCANAGVPHGTVAQVWFYSEITKKMTRFHVYTPPGYENSTKALPVLVLQHGGGDNDASWSTIGRANFIMDNLYATDAVVPMVVIMPMGHPTDGFFGGLGVATDPYYAQLFNEILPLAEQRFGIRKDRFGRAYAGLSMGGLQALNIALFAPEKFGYVLPLSTGYFEPQRNELVQKYADQLKNPQINALKLFWIAMGGESDIAYQNGLAVNKILDDFGIKYQTNTYAAGHTFITWRHNLVEFAPLLFRD